MAFCCGWVEVRENIKASERGLRYQTVRQQCPSYGRLIQEGIGADMPRKPKRAPLSFNSFTEKLNTDIMSVQPKFKVI